MFFKALFSSCCPTSSSIPSRSVFSKKEQWKDVESSSKPTVEEHEAQGISVQEDDFPFMQASWFMLSMAKFFGFHNLRRGSGGEWEASPWRLVPLLVHFTISMAGLVALLYLIFFCDLKYYQSIMILPIGFGIMFCIDTYLSTFNLSKHYLEYISTIEVQEVKIKSINNMYIIAAGTFVVSTLYTWCSLRVTNLSLEVLSILVVPVFITTYLPTFLDMHMFCFNLMLKQQIVKLRHRIRGVSHWTTKEVNGVARQWLLLCRLFKLHNKLFQRSLQTRLMVSMVQVMAFTYAVFRIDLMMKELTIQISQAMVVLSILLPLAWTLARSLSLAFNGEVISNVYESVLDEMRTMVVRGDHWLESVPEMRDLRRLLTRMEARPLALKVWGRDNLGAGIFVQNAGMVLTYLVMVVQMQPSYKMDSFGLGVIGDKVRSLIKG